MNQTIKTTHFSKGFSLIEIIIAIVVFSIAATVVTAVLDPSIKEASNPAIQIRAAELGQAYLEEILGKRFDQNSGIGSVTRCNEAGQPACTCNGPEGEARANFNDVDDYHNLNETATNALGVNKANYAGYTVSITVTCGIGGQINVGANDAKRIDIIINEIYFFV